MDKNALLGKNPEMPMSYTFVVITFDAYSEMCFFRFAEATKLCFWMRIIHVSQKAMLDDSCSMDEGDVNQSD